MARKRSKRSRRKKQKQAQRRRKNQKKTSINPFSPSATRLSLSGLPMRIGRRRKRKNKR
jgi:hypothetical protein